MASSFFDASTNNSLIRGRVNWSSVLDENNNKSSVTATLILKRYDPLPPATQYTTAGNGTWTININGTSKTINEYKSIINASPTTIISNTVDVYHNYDGTKKCPITITGGFYSQSYKVTNASGDATLDNNYRKATIVSAPDFTDMDNPLITFNNYKNYPIQFKIENLVTLTDMIATETFANYNGNSYVFDLTESQREILRTASANYSALSVRFTVVSTVEGLQYYSFLDRTMTIVGGEPTFTDFIHEDIEPKSLALTGDSSIYIQNLSKCQVTIPLDNKMVANKYANPNIYSFSFAGINSKKVYSDVSDVVLDSIQLNYPSKNLSVSAIDSRNKTTTVDKPLNLISVDRSQSTFSATAARDDFFSNNVAVSCEGDFTPITISGIQKNTITITIKHRPVGSTIWTIGTSTGILDLVKNTYTATASIICDVDEENEVEMTCEDYIGQIGQTLKSNIHKCIPIAHFGANNTVGINMIPTGTKKGLYLLPDDQLWDMIYPVDSCFISIYNDPPFPSTNQIWVNAGVISTQGVGGGDFNVLRRTQ